MRLFPIRRRTLPAALALVAPLALTLPFVAAASDKPKVATPPPSDVERVQALVDRLRVRLALGSTVRASIVPKNALLFSVEADKLHRDTYVLKVDAGFLAHLTDTELEAVVAHELGHVWIFTHHPYLQTEQLANQVAMRVVDRTVLETVYEKVWARGGTKGQIVRVLGR
jgi:predicted Zn-dependent protease